MSNLNRHAGEQMTTDVDMQVNDEGLAELVKIAMEESGFKNKDVCNAMGLSDESNASKKIRNGSLIARTEDFFKFLEVTKSPAMRSYVATRCGLTSSEEVNTVDRELKHLRARNEKYKSMIKMFMDEDNELAE